MGRTSHRPGVATSNVRGLATGALADSNGDGRDDLVLFRNGWWYVNTNRDGVADVIVPFGIAGDLPVLFDHDGDGKPDPCVVRNGIWQVNTKLDGAAQAIWDYGVGTDLPFAWNE